MTDKYRFTVRLETRSGVFATLSRHRTYEAAERRADEHRKADAGKHPIYVQEHLAAPPRSIKVDTAAMRPTDEFPDFDYDLPVIEGFEDTSWHNDICPSLTRKANDPADTLILWCDYADPAKRENADVKRFNLTKGEYGVVDNMVTLCESDDIAAILAAIQTA